MPIQIDEDIRINTPQAQRDFSVQELIANKPSFIVRWGTSIFFIILLLLCVMCWFIQYPDVVVANAKLTSINAPKTVISKTDGKLIKLTVTEGQSVIKNAVIGYMESTASPEIVMALAKELDSLSILLNNNRVDQNTQFFHFLFST